VQASVEPSHRPLDPCAPEPITDVAESVTWIGGPPPEGAPPVAMAPWRRLYDRALGLLHGRQEDLGDADASLERALGRIPPGQDRERAMVLQLWADVATREGRTGDALARLGDAERAFPGHPAVARATADAFATVWRWNDAMAPMERAAIASPLDDALWARLAIACGSADDPQAAMTAASHGLELTPRDPDLLRVQALALDRLGGPPASTEDARAAFDAWHGPDTAPAVKNACASRYTWCALERTPVHVHTMRSAWR